MTVDLELLKRSVSTVKHADTRSMFQLILNNFIMDSRRLSTSTDVSSSLFVCLFLCLFVCPEIFSALVLVAAFALSTFISIWFLLGAY